MTINLLKKIYFAWCRREQFDEILSADDMLLSGQVQIPYQRYWLKRFGAIWDKCQELEYQRHKKRKGKQNDII